MKRINVIGTSGSGKSTLSKALAQVLDIPYIQLDFLYWKPNWEEPGDEELFQKLEAALSADTWVLDGNYSRTTPIKWPRTDTVIWIDYSFWRTFWQIVRRSLRRAWTQEELWEGTGNRESFYKSFFTRDSVIWWMLTSYHRTRKRYQKIFESDLYPHITFIRLGHPREVAAFLQDLKRK